MNCVHFSAVARALIMVSNNEVERRVMTPSESSLFQSFDPLVPSQKLRYVAPIDC